MRHIRKIVMSSKSIRSFSLVTLLITMTFFNNLTAKTDRPIEKANVTKVDFSVYFDFVVEEGKPDVFLRFKIPPTIPDKQKILGIQYSYEPSRFFTQKG